MDKETFKLFLRSKNTREHSDQQSRVYKEFKLEFNKIVNNAQ